MTNYTAIASVEVVERIAVTPVVAEKQMFNFEATHVVDARIGIPAIMAVIAIGVFGVSIAMACKLF